MPWRALWLSAARIAGHLLVASTAFAQAPPLGVYDQNAMSELTPRLSSPWGQWYFQSDVLFLDRNRPDRIVTSFRGEFDMGLPEVASTTKDLSFDFEPGARITVGRNFGPDRRLEVTYIGFLEWDDSLLITDAADELGSALFFADGYDSNELITSSELRSVEVNWRLLGSDAPAIAFSALTGFRYLMIDEEFASLFRGDGGLREEVRIVTENDLLGWQLGGEVRVRPAPRLRIGAQGKAGLFLNIGDRSHSFAVFDPGAGESFDGRGSSHDNDLAAALDGSLFATFDVIPGVAIRAGYDVLFVTGIALAPEQYGIKTIFDGELDDGGSTVYHGPSAAVEVLW